MGSVLHREQFFMSARARFTTALAHLEPLLAQQQQASATTTATTASTAANGTSSSTECCMHEHCSTAGVHTHNGSSRHSSNTGATCCTKTSSSSTLGGSSSSEATSQLTSLSELIVACHLNIAAGALLQQRDCPLAILHCTQVMLGTNCYQLMRVTL
jgi:hypothetical protein